MEKLYGMGYLSVAVSDASGAFPIKGALVGISRYASGEGLLYSLRTDRDGLTPAIQLAAPLKSESLLPRSEKPFSEYLVTVKKDGYYTTENIALPIFDGVSTRQSVSLLPLTEADALSPLPPERIYYEGDGYAALRGEAGGDRA